MEFAMNQEFYKYTYTLPLETVEQLQTVCPVCDCGVILGLGHLGQVCSNGCNCGKVTTIYDEGDFFRERFGR